MAALCLAAALGCDTTEDDDRHAMAIVACELLAQGLFDLGAVRKGLEKL